MAEIRGAHLVGSAPVTEPSEMSALVSDHLAGFEPFRSVGLPADTELYLGLVHETGGLEGTRRRIDAASQVVPRFGVATECGLGRRELTPIGPLLDQHAALSEPISG